MGPGTLCEQGLVERARHKGRCRFHEAHTERAKMVDAIKGKDPFILEKQTPIFITTGDYTSMSVHSVRHYNPDIIGRNLLA
jgi:hypothetical protein